ncbi:nitroreductase family deazaflavin-dependent oxidoreductase [Nocardia sp. NPDC059240]|uniref:nitroreductase family deazaflavin-dependent oxidoreductase n=1 Tax=Nocardia sp. NPDC059240 TaxID=3346786 RepID=UPI00368E38D3
MSTVERNYFPAWFDRIQSKYMNPVVRRIAPYLPGFAVIGHQGRKSGKVYSTPVNAFRAGGSLYVAMGHGRTDWIRNTLAAGEADAHYAFRRFRLVNPRVVARGEAPTDAPLVARLAARSLPLFVADLEAGGIK